MFWKFIIPGALVVLLGGLWGWEYVALRQADADWDRISNQTRANAERIAAGGFHARQDRLRLLVEGLASRPALRQGLLGGVEGRRTVFRLLADAAAGGTGLELRGPDGQTIAWAGTGGPTPAFLVRAAIGNTTSSSVIKSPIGAQLVVATSVPSGGGAPGVLVGRIPISASYALSNRFIQSTSLADEISARAGTQVEFQFDDPTHDEGVVITGVDGAMIGFAAAAPPDRGATMAAMRDDILVIDGGMVEVPGPVDFHFDFGFPPGKAYACMAETMVLALEGRFEDYTLGKRITRAQVDEITALADRHGFRLSGFRSFEQPVTDDQIEHVRQRARARV